MNSYATPSQTVTIGSILDTSWPILPIFGSVGTGFASNCSKIDAPQTEVAHELNHELTPYELGVRDAHATQTEVALRKSFGKSFTNFLNSR